VTAHFSLKPVTAGYRLLSLDGGGTRAVIALEELRLLQESLGPLCRVQDFFNMVMGTSSGKGSSLHRPFQTNAPSGGIIALTLVKCGWELERCISTFIDIAKKTFGAEKHRSATVTRRLWRSLRCWLTDGKYDASAFETALQSIFGARNRLFQWAPNSLAAKVAVTATSISKPSAFIFSNYNASKSRSKE